MEITVIAIHLIVEGKIVEEWTEFDAYGMMKQIGAIHEIATSQR